MTLSITLSRALLKPVLAGTVAGAVFAGSAYLVSAKTDAPQDATGIRGYEVLVQPLQTEQGTGVGRAFFTCPAGKKAIYGGLGETNQRTYTHSSYPQGNGDRWIVSVTETGITATSSAPKLPFGVYVICVFAT